MIAMIKKIAGLMTCCTLIHVFPGATILTVPGVWDIVNQLAIHHVKLVLDQTKISALHVMEEMYSDLLTVYGSALFLMWPLLPQFQLFQVIFVFSSKIILLLTIHMKFTSLGIMAIIGVQERNTGLWIL